MRVINFCADANKTENSLEGKEVEWSKHCNESNMTIFATCLSFLLSCSPVSLCSCFLHNQLFAADESNSVSAQSEDFSTHDIFYFALD